MLGTIVNTLAIFIGGAAGSAIRGGLSERFKHIVMQAVGLSVLFTGIATALSKLIMPEASPILFIVSLVAGSTVGEAIDIEGRLNKFGVILEDRFAKNGDPIAKGFVSASILFCVGTMAILGSVQSGLNGDHSVLFAKSVLDGVCSVILASSLGLGVVLSGFSVLAYQGLITLFSGFLSNALNAEMMNEMSIVGGILITGIGINILEIKQIKVGNMLPSVLVPVIALLIRGLF